MTVVLDTSDPNAQNDNAPQVNNTEQTTLGPPDLVVGVASTTPDGPEDVLNTGDIETNYPPPTFPPPCSTAPTPSPATPLQSGPIHQHTSTPAPLFTVPNDQHTNNNNPGSTPSTTALHLDSFLIDPVEAVPPDSSAEIIEEVEVANPDDELETTDTGSAVEVDTSHLRDPRTGEVIFPMKQLNSLDDMVNRSRWIVPVLPDGDLEKLIKYSTDLVKAGIDTECDACQRFYREGLTTSFQKILFDEAVSGWKQEIQSCIFRNCIYLLDLCILKIPDDCLPLLELEAMVFAPNSKYQLHSVGKFQDFREGNANLLPDSSVIQLIDPPTDPPQPAPTQVPEVYAVVREHRTHLSLLIDFINHFGRQGGFESLYARFCAPRDTLSIATIHAQIKPFGTCADYLSQFTIKHYIQPIMAIVLDFLSTLTDDELKKESKTETKSDSLSGIIRSMQSFLRQIPGQEPAVKEMEHIRLKLILRVLQVAPFNGKMNALIELNKMILPLHTIYKTYKDHEDDAITAAQMAQWIQNNDVLSIILRENLHQPQYVEKLEKIVRFMLKENSLGKAELDRIWDAQEGKHEAIVKNVHDLLAKLAWDFQPEQLDYLFGCFQASWTRANRKQRERLIEMIRHLAEEDKDGVMAQKVLGLLWEMAIGEDCPLEIMEIALAAHIKILDFSCIQNRDTQKLLWLRQLGDILKAGDQPRYVIPAMKQITDICSLFNVAPQNYNGYPGRTDVYRNDVVNQIQKEYSIVNLVADNLVQYMAAVQRYRNEHPEASDSRQVFLDGRYYHSQHVHERLKFIRFVLRESMQYLEFDQARQVWQCLAENAVYEEDRESCFRWFVKLMQEEQDLQPECTRAFFEQHVVRIEPILLTQNGMTCFELFFRHVNSKENKLRSMRHGYELEDTNPTGLDYIWLTITSASNEDVASKAIGLLRGLFTNLGSGLLPHQRAINEDLVQNCLNRLQAGLDTLGCLSDNDPGVMLHLQRMVRVASVLKEFLAECDNQFASERTIPPLCRSWRGTIFSVTVSFSNMPCLGSSGGPGGRSNSTSNSLEDREVVVHSNETVGRLRAKILRLKVTEPAQRQKYRVELFFNNTPIDFYDDHKLLTFFNIKDGAPVPPLIKAKLTSMTILQTISSPDSSSDSSHNGSPTHHRVLPSSSSSAALGSSGGGLGLASSNASSTIPLVHEMAGNFEGNITTIQAEVNLPGVIMSKLGDYAKFLFKVGDQANRTQCVRLKDSVYEILSLMPSDESIAHQLNKAVLKTKGPEEESLEELLLGKGPTETLYRFQVFYQLMLPANEKGEETISFTHKFLVNGGARTLLDLLSRNNFLVVADLATRKLALIWLLRLLHHAITCLAFAYVEVAKFQVQQFKVQPSESQINLRQVLLQMLPVSPSPGSKVTDYKYAPARQVARYMADKCTLPELEKIFPDAVVIRAIMKIAWSVSSSNLDMMYATTEDIHSAVERTFAATQPPSGPPPHSISHPAGLNNQALHPPAPLVQSQPASSISTPSLCSLANQNAGLHREDTELATEALECLTLCLGFCPDYMDKLRRDKSWQHFVIDLVLLVRSQGVRSTAQEQFVQIATRCSMDHQPVQFFIQLLFMVVNTQVKSCANQSMEYFTLLERLLEKTKHLPNRETLLNNEIEWLKKIRADHLENKMTPVEDFLLQGHLKICKELVTVLSPDKKYCIGSHKDGHNLIQHLIEDFIFPASKQLLLMRKSQDTPGIMERTSPICSSPASVEAAFNLLVALVAFCPHNMSALSKRLIQMYYSDPSQCLNEWEYLPPVGPRPPDGFVGLKNAGATCYMNSILQQLFMTVPLRDAVLAANTGEEDYSDEDEFEAHNSRSGVGVGPLNRHTDSIVEEESNKPVTQKRSSKENHNIAVLRHVQAIFGHLAHSILQYYVPRGFWKQFRLWGDAVNLREQHDALEFFNCLVDNLDEAFKSLGLPKVIESVMGGSFADQKICIDCPHRYSREESFTTLNVDMRNQQNLVESLEQYVKGDLLEGDNAYLCENCEKKVDTVKRLCIKRLPPVLAIQLKRFDYDWERDTAIKFNDYFEFPRELDMEPYTAAGLARADAMPVEDPLEVASQATKYTLKGVVVHSGQASGGHYYSYIRHLKRSTGTYVWYKFDDNEVSEVKMDDMEEMRNQWFGGEFMGEVYDQMMKRMSYRKQKRWWNAYILVYEREDFAQSIEIQQLNKHFERLSCQDGGPVPIPRNIERLVQRQNIDYMHNKAQFTAEYFAFMRKLPECHFTEVRVLSDEDMEHVCITTMDLLIKFAFSIGFRTKKVLRKSASEWAKALKRLLNDSGRIRRHFAEQVFFYAPGRLAEYLLECPSPEIRQCFSQLVVFIAHKSLREIPSKPSQDHTNQIQEWSGPMLADHIIHSVLALLNKEVIEYVRNYAQFFRLFIDYINFGDLERAHLLRLDVPALFIKFAMELGSSQPVHYNDLSPLVTTVSLLIRCCDLSLFCQSSISPPPSPLENPYRFAGEDRMPRLVVKKDSNLAHDLFDQPARFIKKMLDDTLNAQTYQDVALLLNFCCYENMSYSTIVLDELVWMLTFSYSAELKPYLDLTKEILSITDSWQVRRISTVLRGHDDVDPLLDTMLRLKNHQQKRSYQMLKMLVRLFSTPSASQALYTDQEMARKFRQGVEWLTDELNRKAPPVSGCVSGGVTGSQWVQSGSHAPSNENSNSYFIERSDSAMEIAAEAVSIVNELETSYMASDASVDASYMASDASVDAHPSVSGTKSLPLHLPSHTDLSTGMSRSSRQIEEIEVEMPEESTNPHLSNPPPTLLDR